MARNNLYRGLVSEVASALLEDRLGARVQNVKERLESGRYSGFADLFAEFKTTGTEASGMPPAAREAFEQVWAVVVGLARQQLDEQRNALEAMKQQLLRDQVEPAVEQDRLQTALTEQQQQSAQLIAERDELRRQLDLVRTDLIRTDEQRKAAVQRGDELKIQLESLQQQFTRAATPSAKPAPKRRQSRARTTTKKDQSD